MSTKRGTPAGGELNPVYDAWLPGGTCTAEMRLRIVHAAKSAGLPGSEFMRRAVAFYLDCNFPKQDSNIHKQEKTAVRS